MEIPIRQIMEMLPHRYPFLLVDRVIDCTPFETIKAIKNVTFNEPFFTGHFPDKPIMPGVLILEAMAQATGLLAFYSNNAVSNAKNTYYLVGVDKARFKRPVEPGDQLVIEARLIKRKRGIYQFQATTHVGDEFVSSAQFLTTELEAKT